MALKQKDTAGDADGSDGVPSPWMARFKNEVDDDDEDAKVFLREEEKVREAEDGDGDTQIIAPEEDSGIESYIRRRDDRGATEAPPDHNEELNQIIGSIDQRHCDKYKWYVERHIRRIYEPNKVLSRQLYYRRVMGKHGTELIRADPRGRERWVVSNMRPSSFRRVDYEATYAHHKARKTSSSLSWSSSTKRVPADRLDAILDEAPKAYGWPEVVTNKNVDEILIIDDIRDLDAYDGCRSSFVGAFPHSDGVLDEPQVNNRVWDIAVAVGDVDEPEAQVDPPSPLGSVTDLEERRPSARTLYGLDPILRQSVAKRKEQEELRGDRKKRLCQQRQERLRRLEVVHQQFVDDMETLCNEYHRKRLEIETEYGSVDMDS